jgi:hypothetical protein
LIQKVQNYREKLKTKFCGGRPWRWGDEPRHWRRQIQYESHCQVEKLIQSVVKCGRCQFFSPLEDVCWIPRRKSIRSPEDAAKEPEFEDNLPPRKYSSRGCSMFSEAGYDPDNAYLLSPMTLTGRIFDRLEELFEKRYTENLHVPSKTKKYRRQYQIIKSNDFFEVSWGVRAEMALKLRTSKKTYDRDVREIKDEIRRLRKTDPDLRSLLDLYEAATTL